MTSRRVSGDAPWPPSQADIVAASSGDTNAMARVLTAGHPRIVAFYHGVGLPYDLISETTSETLEAMVRAFPKLREPSSFEHWFWAIARNRMRTALRRYRSAKTPSEAQVSPTTPEEAAIVHEEHTHIRAALDTLSSRDRQLLWLRDVEGLEYDQIGERLGVAIGTVRVSIHRARRRLEAAFNRIEGS